MAKEKFSQFDSTTFASIKGSLVNSSIYLVGVNENDFTNFKLNYLEILGGGSNKGTGSEVFKDVTDLTTFNFRKLNAGSDKITVTQNTNDISIDAVESEFTLDNIGGILGLEKGGTGSALSDPGGDRILFWDDSAGDTAWLEVGSGLDLTGTTLSLDYSTPLTTKGDIFVYGTSEDRLPIGTNGQVLVANSSEDTGLEWQALSTTDEKLKIDSGATAGYLGANNDDGILRTGNRLSYTDGGDFVTINVNEGNIDIDNLDNTTANIIKDHTLSNTLESNGETLAHTETSPSVGSEDSTGLTFQSNNMMYYFNDVSDADKGDWDFKLSRVQNGASHATRGARLLLEKNEDTIAIDDVLGELWMSSTDTSGSDDGDGSIGLVGYAIANHDASNRGGYLKIKARQNGVAPSGSADDIITINENGNKETYFEGPIRTSGTSITASEWELGQFNSGETLGGTTGTVAIEIDGTVYYLSAGTTSS